MHNNAINSDPKKPRCAFCARLWLALGKSNRRSMVVVIEIVLLLVTLVLGVMWVFNPSGNYEPSIVLCGAILAVLELVRRQSKKQHEHEPEPFKEVAELLKELKALRAEGQRTSSLKSEPQKKNDPELAKLQEYFRQKRQIEKCLIEIANQGETKVSSGSEAIELVSVPEVFRSAMREYLQEGEERIRESLVYLDWVLKLGETIEDLVENRLAKGAWG